jgi:hypothetical protein
MGNRPEGLIRKVEEEEEEDIFLIQNVCISLIRIIAESLIVQA